MEVRNRKQPKVVETKEEKVEAILYNEPDWDFAAIARKRMQFVQLNDPDGDIEPRLSVNEQKKVKKFQEHVKGLEYKRLSAKYSSGYQRQRVHKINESMKSPIRQVMDTVSPLITVLVTLLCCLVMSNYFLKNIIHEMAGRIAFGLVVGSVLATIEIYFILKRFQAEWDKEDIVKL